MTPTIRALPIVFSLSASALGAGSDFNGDGFDDLVVGNAAEAVAGKPGAGTVIVFPGSAQGLSVEAASFAEQVAFGAEVTANDAFGADLVAEDFDGGGKCDLDDLRE